MGTSRKSRLWMAGGLAIWILFSEPLHTECLGPSINFSRWILAIFGWFFWWSSSCHESQDYEWRWVFPFESFFPSPYILSEGQPINVDLAWKIQKMIKWNWRKTAIYAINDILYRQFYELPFIYKVKMRLQMGPSIIYDPINAGVQKSIFGSGRSWSGSGS